jgi:hypothetical protein
MTKTMYLAMVAVSAGCGMQVRTWSTTSRPAPAPAEPSAPVAAQPTTASAPAPAPIPPDQGCSWQPDVVVQQHEGGGRYAPMEYPLDLQLDTFIYYQAIKDFEHEARVKETGAGTNSIYFDCAEISKVHSDPDVLAAIKKRVKDPASVLAAHYQPRVGWKVDTDHGNPISKSRVIIIYSRREL